MQKPSACVSHVHQAAGDLPGRMRRDGPRICSLLPHPEAQIQCQAQEEMISGVLGSMAVCSGGWGRHRLRAGGPAGLVDGGALGLPCLLGTGRQFASLSPCLSFPITLQSSGTLMRSPGFLFLFALDAMRFPLLNGRYSDSAL